MTSLGLSMEMQCCQKMMNENQGSKWLAQVRLCARMLLLGYTSLTDDHEDQ